MWVDIFFDTRERALHVGFVLVNAGGNVECSCGACGLRGWVWYVGGAGLLLDCEMSTFLSLHILFLGIATEYRGDSRERHKIYSILVVHRAWRLFARLEVDVEYRLSVVLLGFWGYTGCIYLSQRGSRLRLSLLEAY